MKRNLVFYEYEGFETEDGISDSLSESELSAQELNCLEWLGRSFGSTNGLFQISRSAIRANHYVGAVSIGSKQLQIFPKLLRRKDDTSKSALLRTLMLMLEYVHEIEHLDLGAASLADSTGSFIEIYIRVFADRLVRLVRTNPPRQYVSQDENLVTIRGRIKFTQDVRHNSFNRARKFCEYDEFTGDNIVSQTLKYVASSLARLSTIPETHKRLNWALQVLGDVQNRTIDYATAQTAKVPRQQKQLYSLHRLALMFLRNIRTTISSGRAEGIAVVFDMNQLFESFVFELIRRNQDLLDVSSIEFQRGRRLVKGIRNLSEPNFEKRSLFGTYQDIVVTFRNHKSLIIDTKYKLLRTEEISRPNVANGDVYQLLAYREISPTQAPPAVALLYPEYQAPIKLEFRVNTEKDVRFAVATLALGVDLAAGVAPLLSELRSFFSALELTGAPDEHLQRAG